MKREVLARDQVCQSKDPQTGEVCGSTFFLQVDHLPPTALDGTNEPGNLSVLCSRHNKWEATSFLGNEDHGEVFVVISPL